MWALSTVLLTLGKVPCTAWEKRVLLMKAQTSPALQRKGGRVSTQRAQSQYSLPGPSKSPSTDPRLQGPEYNSEPCFQSIQTSALRTAKGPDRRDMENSSTREPGAPVFPCREAVGKGLRCVKAQPPGASSPLLLLPLLCPVLLGSAPVNNGSFLAQPPSTGLSTLPRVPS